MLLIPLAIVFLLLFVRTFQMMGFLIQQKPNRDLEDDA
jgi:hypothetical protein